MSDVPAYLARTVTADQLAQHLWDTSPPQTDPDAFLQAFAFCVSAAFVEQVEPELKRAGWTTEDSMLIYLIDPPAMRIHVLGPQGTTTVEITPSWSAAERQFTSVHLDYEAVGLLPSKR